jgi:hypothetical protein
VERKIDLRAVHDPVDEGVVEVVRPRARSRPTPMVLAQVEVNGLVGFSGWGCEHDISEDIGVVLSSHEAPWASYGPDLCIPVTDDSGTRGDTLVESPHRELEDSPTWVASGRARLGCLVIHNPCDSCNNGTQANQHRECPKRADPPLPGFVASDAFVDRSTSRRDVLTTTHLIGGVEIRHHQPV